MKRVIILLETWNEDEIKTIGFLVRDLVLFKRVNLSNVACAVKNSEQIQAVIKHLNKWGYTVRIRGDALFTILELTK